MGGDFGPPPLFGMEDLEDCGLDPTLPLLPNTFCSSLTVCLGSVAEEWPVVTVGLIGD